MQPNDFADQLLNAETPWVALTGAGLSVASGLPDFRSPTGLWSQHNAQKIARKGSLEEDPVLFWSLYRERFEGLRQAQPNTAHTILARWEQQGWLSGIITQNVDGFHTAAGSQIVAEMHGRLENLSCARCGSRTRYEVLNWQAGVPKCGVCGEGVIRPGIVLFDEMLPAEATEQAMTLTHQTRGMLCLGSTLQVYPVAGLPADVLDAGGSVVVVNNEPTSYSLFNTDRASSVVGDLQQWLIDVDSHLPHD